MQVNEEVKIKESGGGNVSSLLDCYERIVERAFLIAEKDKIKITVGNAEHFFMAAIAQELLETPKGQEALTSAINKARYNTQSTINQCDGCRDVVSP